MQLQLGGNSQGLVSLITLLGKQLVPTVKFTRKTLSKDILNIISEL